MKRPVALAKFIPTVSPRFRAPTHLAPLLDLFDRVAAGEPVRATASAPPRMGKTEATKHAIARALLLKPGLRVGFAMYSAQAAQKRSREIRELYQRAGGHVAASARAKADWRTGVDDGGLWAGGVEGAWMGEGFDLFVGDDLVKGRAQAESAAERERTWDWLNGDAYSRLEPGASMLVLGHRWTVHDPIGRLVEDGWEHVALPAISDQGRALWPERYSVEALRRIEEQVGAYTWSSMYMQSPFARGGQLFSDCVFYDALPSPLRYSIGCDFAYSKKTKSDYSVAVVLGESEGVHYVVDLVRLQARAPEFKRTLDALGARYPGLHPFAYVGGQEGGVVDLMNDQGGVQIRTAAAKDDKFIRAQPVAAAWNAGNVRVPRHAPWLDALVAEVVSFTGEKDPHDDQVDALSAAFDALATESGIEVTPERQREWLDLARQPWGGEPGGYPGGGDGRGPLGI